jgi:hypothetical protein
MKNNENAASRASASRACETEAGARAWLGQNVKDLFSLKFLPTDDEWNEVNDAATKTFNIVMKNKNWPALASVRGISAAKKAFRKTKVGVITSNAEIYQKRFTALMTGTSITEDDIRDAVFDNDESAIRTFMSMYDKGSGKQAAFQSGLWAGMLLLVTKFHNQYLEGL